MTMSDEPPAGKGPGPGESVLDLPGPVSLEQQAKKLGRAEEIELERRQLSVVSLRQDISLRKRFAQAFLALHTGVVVIVMLFVGMTGCGKMQLSDQVLIALIAGTVAELVGLVLAVVKSLFPAPKE